MKTFIVGFCVATALSVPAADPVIEWNRAALDAIRFTRANPPAASRALAITHAAVFDAVNGIQRTHRPYFVTALAPAGASPEAAVAAAANAALAALFPATNFTALHDAQLAAVTNVAAREAGAAWGRSVAAGLLALRAGDGATNVVPYTSGTDPGEWRPTLPAHAPALLPGWGLVRPFTMVSGDQFRPQPPPALNSAAYAYEFETVKQYGAANSTVRSANQTEVALFWADGGGTATPPGHWNVIAQDVAVARGTTLAENARLFALLNFAAADSAIACWDAKYAYNLWRPITAVREADNDGNPETPGDPVWTPLIATPPFPEYSSGHSTFSRSAATVLAGFFGTDAIAFSTVSDGLPGVTRSYAGFSAAADEAGISRLFGGIHWPSANLHGQACGAQIGQQVLAHFLVPLTAAQFTAIRQSPAASQVEIMVEPNRPYIIRASSDLLNWTDLATISSPTGRATFTDPDPPAGMRFYQAVAR